MPGLLAVAKDRENVREAAKSHGPIFSPALTGAEIAQASENAARWALRTRRVKATDDERIALAQEVALAALRSGATLVADDRRVNVATYSSSGRATRRTYRERAASISTRAYLRRTALGLMRDSRAWLDCAESHRTAGERQRGADSMIMGADWTLDEAAQSGPLAIAATRAAIAASEHGAAIRDSEAHALADALAARIAATMKPTDRRNVRVAAMLALGVNLADVATRERVQVGSLRVYAQRGRARIMEVAASASEWRELVADVAASADLQREGDGPQLPAAARAALAAIDSVSESVGMGTGVYLPAAKLTPRERPPEWGTCHGAARNVLRYLAAWDRRLGLDSAASVTPRTA